MSYYLYATKPEWLFVNGSKKLVETGDVLLLSNNDAKYLLSSPIGSSFVVTSTEEPEDNLNIKKVSDSAIQNIEDPKDIYSTPNFNPVKEELPFYDENQEFFDQLTGDSFEDRLKSSLPQDYNWKNLVNHVKSLGQLDPIPVDYVNFIQSKFSSLTSVVNECKRILTPEV